MTNAEYAATLRKIAEIYEQNPDIPLPYLVRVGSGDTIYVHDTETLRAVLRAFGPCSRKEHEHFTFTPIVAKDVLAIYAYRQALCERKVVGRRIVPERIIPAKVVPEHEEDVVEWSCPQRLDDPMA